MQRRKAALSRNSIHRTRFDLFYFPARFCRSHGRRSGGSRFTAQKRNSLKIPGPNFSFDEGIHLDKLSVDGSRLLFSTMFAQNF